MLTRGAILPHAPLLLEAVVGPKVSGAARSVAFAASGIDLGEPDLLVVVSPHGRRSGVYETASGDLTDFGIKGAGLIRGCDLEAASQLATIWERPLLPWGLDHGSIVPLALLGEIPYPVVCCTFADGEPAEAISDANDLAVAIRALAKERNVAVVASFNGSAAMSPRAPLTQRDAGEALSSAIWASLAGGDEVSPELWSAGGSCGAGPLTLWLRLFGDKPAVRLIDEHPYGVGYPVAVSGD
jgi:hypothetical protein